MHKFYHADRNSSLLENQKIELDNNQLSRFGAAYWPSISQRDFSKMNKAQLREFHLEEIRNETEFSSYTSRLKCIFGANSLEDAIWFAGKILPIPDHPIPIIEIYAEKFWSLDANWLDYDCGPAQSIANYRSYWYAQISNHCPKKGERRPPKLEVLIALPANTGNIVHYVPTPVIATNS